MSIRIDLRIFGLLAAVLAATVTATVTATAAPPRFAVVAKIPLPGPVRWDYLTSASAADRLYAAQGDRVDVIDTRNLHRVGVVAPVDGAHGIAVAPAFGHGFATAGQGGSVIMFDLKTLRTIRTIRVGKGPDAIAYDAATGRILVPNEDSRRLYAINARTGRVLGSLAIHADPEFIVTDGRGRAYLNLNSTDRIAVIDTRKLDLIRTIAVGPRCQGPTGLAIDRRRGRLFVSCDNDVLAVVDIRRGTVVAAVPLTGFTDAVRYDPRDSLVLAPGIDGTLSVIGMDRHGRYRVLQRLRTARGARTLAFDRRTRTVYLSTATLLRTLPPAPGKSYPRRVFAPGSFRILVIRPQPADHPGARDPR